MRFDETFSPGRSTRRLSVLVAAAVVAVSAAWSVVVDDPRAPHLALAVGVFTLLVVSGVLATLTVGLRRRSRAEAAHGPGDARPREGLDRT